MGYDAQLAARVREMFADDLAVREQAMFGGVAFLVAGRIRTSRIGVEQRRSAWR